MPSPRPRRASAGPLEPRDVRRRDRFDPLHCQPGGGQLVGLGVRQCAAGAGWKADGAPAVSDDITISNAPALQSCAAMGCSFVRFHRSRSPLARSI